MEKSGGITLFDQYPYLGGGQVVLLALTEAVRRTARRTILVIPDGRTLERAIRQRFGSTVEILPTDEPRATHGRKHFGDVVGLLLFTIRFVVRHFFDVKTAAMIYGNGSRQFPGLIVLSVLNWRRCCYHVHIDHSAAEKLLIGLAARLPTTFKVIVNSDFIYRRLIDQIPALSTNPKVIVVENALDETYRTRQFVDRFQSPGRTWNIVVLGVLRPEKGQDAAVELARRIDAIHLHVVGRVGDGAESWTSRLKAEAPPNVTFHSPIMDVPAMFDRLDAKINLTPSRWEEPFGLTAIEGMACSCISLVSSRGALVDIARKTGAIVFGDTVDELVAAVEKLLQMNPRDLSQSAHRQFSATMQYYGPDRFIESIERICVDGLTSPSKS